MKKPIVLFSAILFLTSSLTPVIAQQTKPADKNYIVVLKDSVDTDTAINQMSAKHHFNAENRFKNAFKGYSAQLDSDQLKQVKADGRVKFVSEDKLVSIDTLRAPITQQAQVLPTGVNRVDAENLVNKGDSVGVAIIDTGIQLNHPDLAANIIANKSCVRRTSSANDDNGHGTHVAGTIAALDNTDGVVGAAPQVKLIAVKVLDRSGSGSWSNVICGLDWVAANAARYNIKVVNMSLGGSGSSDNNCGQTNFDALHAAICRVRDAGVTIAVAAGNSNANASTFVPAAYDDSVITVSALADSDGAAGGLGPITSYGADDTFATFSNWGSVVDIAAPGVSIYSTYKGSTYATLSGTSMATPHVAAAAALYINSHPGSAWSAVRNGLISAGEALNFGHTDPSGKHPEPVLNVLSL